MLTREQVNAAMSLDVSGVVDALKSTTHSEKDKITTVEFVGMDEASSIFVYDITLLGELGADDDKGRTYVRYYKGKLTADYWRVLINKSV